MSDWKCTKCGKMYDPFTSIAFGMCKDCSEEEEYDPALVDEDEWGRSKETGGYSNEM